MMRGGTSDEKKDGPELCLCIGPTTKAGCKDKAHIVMKCENGKEINKCTRCSIPVCMTCQENAMCLPCFSESWSEDMAPASEDDLIGDLLNDKQMVSIDAMKKELDKEGLELHSSASAHEIEEIHEAYLLKKKLATVTGNLDHDVVFPILPANAIDQMSGCSYSSTQQLPSLPNMIEKIICKIDLGEGGSFISNESAIPNELLPPVLCLLASLVEYKSDFKKYTKFDHQVYKALPSLFVEMANGSRTQSGFRLLRRCCRHAMDTRAKELMKTSAQLFETKDGTIGIVINNFIPASMKSDDYDTSVAFTSQNFLV